MPKRKDLKKILIIGSGPIIIGSAAEFDYSGTQACLALKSLGYKVVLVNPNPATIMTDKSIVDKVYMEPLKPKFLKWIISMERPCAILPNLGGQVALNLTVKLSKLGILKKYNVEVLGTSIDAIIAAENRNTFKERMQKLNIPMAKSITIKNVDDVIEFSKKIGFPLIIRPSYTMGGFGGGIAKSESELKIIVKRALTISPIHECMIEESLLGFKEIEYEVMRDKNDTAIVVCNMENIDPVGVHTGDSMVIAPSLTLNNKQYQILRDVSLKIIRDFKIEGGCNVQIAQDCNSSKFNIIEINPRVSRSSALASKATGYPIAWISAMIAVGINLDEITNPITKKTYASFEPAIDYVVTKLAMFPFDKFKDSRYDISTYMQATGETMAIGKNFEESFLKALRSLCGEFKFTLDNNLSKSKVELLKEIKNPNAYRIYQIFNAFRKGATIEEVFKNTNINRYFLDKFKHVITIENELKRNKNDLKLLQYSKKYGYSDYGIGLLWNLNEKEIFKLRQKHNILPVYKMIDTCGGEFKSQTNYMYSTYNGFDDETVFLNKNKQKKVLIIGSGPIKIGQGVEFDYSTVKSIWAFKEMGYETIIINNNPETVSTDYSIADKLYFEPINYEDIKNLINHEKIDAVVLQFGGQIAINLSKQLQDENINILGTSSNSIDLSEDRKRFQELLIANNIKTPLSVATKNIKEIPMIAKKIKYPILIRPSYVIGGKGMEIIDNEKQLLNHLKINIRDYKDNVILVDKFIQGKELEVDLVSDGKDIFIPGIMEHIEKSGIHSGDSTTIFPTISVKKELKTEIVKICHKLALLLKVKGLMNVQFIVKDDILYVLEVNLRSSRTIPFISKATKQNIVEYAVKVLCNKKLKDIGINIRLYNVWNKKYYIKSPVFSFHKLLKVKNTILGPEMKSTGESIGIDYNIDKALYKSLLGANINPLKNSIVILTIDTIEHETEIIKLANNLVRVNMKIFANTKIFNFLQSKNIKAIHILDMNHLKNILNKNKISFVISSPSMENQSVNNAREIRKQSLKLGIPVISSVRLGHSICKMAEYMRFLISNAYE